MAHSQTKRGPGPLLDEEKVAVLDNASFHPSPKTRQRIEAEARSSRSRPPSPDLTPIEKTFGALKRRRQYCPEPSLDQIARAFS